MFEIGRDIFKHGFTGAPNNKAGHRRLRAIYYVFVAAFVVFALRTIWLGIEGTDKSRLAGNSGEWAVQRADIVDRNGDILAKNVMSGRIVLRPPRVKDIDGAANAIHSAMSYEFTVADALKLINSGRKFISLKNFASDAELAAIESADIAGLDVEPVQMRRYPKRRLFSHVVGFVGVDGHGLEGAELIYDDYLRENTSPLRLSLDARIQSVFYEQLSQAMQLYEAKAAMGLLMNSQTGEMIAMVSLPDFDPENRQLDPVRNRMFMPLRGVFEMGSIFKIFNTAMAMENGIDKEYYIAEPFVIPDKFGRVAARVTDLRSFKPPRPNLTIEEIMMYSCNVGSAQIALELPDGTQQEFFHRLHLDDALDLDFGRTEHPLLPDKWGPVERATMSYGHGISVTPMHLLLAVNAMTNGGIYIYPTLLRRGVGVVHGQRVLSAEISARLRQIMLQVAEETSGRQARIAGIQIGGKTATAEKYVNGRIDHRKNLTAFVGIFPASAPQYTILVILDEPQATAAAHGVRTAAYNAVPTTGKILDSILPLLFE